MKNRELLLEYHDITENTQNLREFLAIRDRSAAFDRCRELGGIGIPCFVDGERVTLDLNEAFSWIGQPPVRDEEIAERP